MFLLTYHGKPKDQTKKDEDIAGAYINCWIEEEEFEQADGLAREEITDMGWLIIELDEAFTITREDYLEDPSGLEYYEQALIDKKVYVFHTYLMEELEE